MKPIKRVFFIILDSFGIGELPDARDYGDAGSNTLRACFETGGLNIPNLIGLGLFNIDGAGLCEPCLTPAAAFGRMAEVSAGKDTTTGHWELAGVISKKALPTYPRGFPADIMTRFERESGYRALCNTPYSGTQVLKDFGGQHMAGGSVIVYTSADSVFQIAAHKDIVPVEELYRVCRVARGILTAEHGVARVIARPFEGVFPGFRRTAQRKDFSLKPPKVTILDLLSQNGFDTVAVGKIDDIFAGSGITKSIHTKSNREGMLATEHFLSEAFTGLCFTNLVDFDMLYGHRNDAKGYTAALNEFDVWLGGFLPRMKEDDALIIAADHGCDPTPPGTDHTREYTPLIICGERLRKNVNLGTRTTFADAGATILDMFGLGFTAGASVLDQILIRH